MIIKTFLTIGAFVIILSVFGQKPSLELTFTAIDNTTYTQLDSIKIMNRSQGGDTVLYWPDTVLVLDYQVGIHEINNDIGNLQVFQNYPNPVNDKTTISLYVPERDEVNLIITDMLGRMIFKTEQVLDRGHHSFLFIPSGGSLFIFTAQWRGNSNSIKILQAASNSYRFSSLKYNGSEVFSQQHKTTEAIQSLSFNLGDTLLYIGYTDTLQSGILNAPEDSQTHTFQFTTNIPCPETPTVEYEGQVYNTIQVFSQCWLKENLNVGAMIFGTQNMTNNGIFEKYCYNNEPDSCTKYGGLYQWNEMMQYTTQQGTQGICPQGWHLPTDEEWKVLEGAVDSQYSIGDNTWDDIGNRGIDAGTNLKSTIGWIADGNGTDLFSFSGLPGGFRNIYMGGFFDMIGAEGEWWTSSERDESDAWFRNLYYGNQGVLRGFDFGSKNRGFSVRCISDN